MLFVLLLTVPLWHHAQEFIDVDPFAGLYLPIGHPMQYAAVNAPVALL